MWSFWSLSVLLAFSLTPLMALGATVPITFTESGSQLAHSSSINSSASLPSVSLSPADRLPNPFPVPDSSITLYFQNEPQPPLPSRNLLACLELAKGRLIAYLHNYPNGPLPSGSFETIAEAVYFGAVSADGSLTYGDVLATLNGYTLKTEQDGFTSIAAEILNKGTGRRVGYSIVQWAAVSPDES